MDSGAQKHTRSLYVNKQLNQNVFGFATTDWLVKLRERYRVN